MKSEKNSEKNSEKQPSLLPRFWMLHSYGYMHIVMCNFPMLNAAGMAKLHVPFVRCTANLDAFHFNVLTPRRCIEAHNDQRDHHFTLVQSTTDKTTPDQH
jgi:hypothetical protein